MKLEVGKKIYLRDQTEEDKECRSQVLDFNEESVFIAYPIDLQTERTKIIAIGEEFIAHFVDATNVVYSFPAKVVGKNHTSIPALQIAYPEEEMIQKIQRREYVRVATPVDVALLLENGKSYQLVTHDISAGGVALYVGNEEIKLEEEEEVQLTIVLPFRDDAIVHEQVEAKVVRQFEKEKRSIISFQFLKLSEEFQNEIIRFCFERQLQQRRDEKGVF